VLLGAASVDLDNPVWGKRRDAAPAQPEDRPDTATVTEWFKRRRRS
jgi:hypothetical protein